MEKISFEEVSATLNKMNPDKSLRPDGFPTCFFPKCWDFIGMEVIEALEGVQNSGKLLMEVNNTFIALIPKKEKSKTFNDYHLIDLCNNPYKWFTKTMAIRIKKILPNLISEEQIGFV